MKVMNKNLKNLVSLMFLVIVCFGFALLNGCAFQQTSGEGHELFPWHIAFSAGGALAKGESETKVGAGNNAVTEVMNADNNFNEAWANVGVAKAENQIQGVSYSGPQQTNPTLTYSSTSYSSSAVGTALEMKKDGPKKGGI